MRIQRNYDKSGHAWRGFEKAACVFPSNLKRFRYWQLFKTASDIYRNTGSSCMVLSSVYIMNAWSFRRIKYTWTVYSVLTSVFLIAYLHSCDDHKHFKKTKEINNQMTHGKRPYNRALLTISWLISAMIDLYHLRLEQMHLFDQTQYRISLNEV